MNTAKNYGAVAAFMILLFMMIPVVHATELNLVYDANGNLLYGDGKYREYNSLNQLVRIRDSTNVTILEEYVHDPVQERILVKRIWNSTGVAETVYYVDENFVRVVNNSGTYDFVYVKDENGNLVGQINPDGTRLFMHNDLEGSVGVVTNQSGSVVENTTYSPYGEILSGGAVSRFDSEGKEFDSLVGDYDFNFRKFCVRFGIFCQPDTLIQNVYDPQALNRYMFERGNSYKFTDPDGHVIPAIAVALFVVGVSLYTGYIISKNIVELEKEQGGLTYSDAGIAAADIATGAIFSNPATSTFEKILNFAGSNLARLGIRGEFKERISAAHHSNVLSHVQNNININQDVKSSLDRSIQNTAQSGNNVRWFYNSETGKYTYRVGGDIPGDLNYKPITKDSTSSSRSGSSSGSSSRSSSSGGSTITLGGKKYRCTNC